MFSRFSTELLCFVFPECNLLRILYTCSAQTQPDYNTALQALDLAHRWQVQVVVTILCDLLCGMITDDSFAAISEQAALKARVSKTMSYLDVQGIQRCCNRSSNNIGIEVRQASALLETHFLASLRFIRTK